MRNQKTDRTAIETLRNYFFPLPIPDVRVYRNVVQNIPSGAWPPTMIIFTTERWDVGNCWIGANPTRLSAPIPGSYQISYSIEWAANAVGRRTMMIVLNGATLIQGDSKWNMGAADTVAMNGSIEYRMAATEYVELGAIQTSGGGLNILSSASYTAEFMMVRVA